MTGCLHAWKKWEKEQQWWTGTVERGYYQRRECKKCGVAEWKTVPIIDDTRTGT